MDRELIEMDIKEAMGKVVDSLENYEAHWWSPEGGIDSRINDIVKSAVESAIHSIADDLAYKFKVGNYANEPNTEDE